MAWYDNGTRLYWRQNQRGVFSAFAEGQLKRRLKAEGVSTKAGHGELVSPADQELLDLQDNHDVDYAGPLAGESVGPHESAGQRILVTSSPKMIDPVEGRHPILTQIISGLLADDDHDQATYFLAWIKIAYEALMAGIRQPGQCIVFAGPVRIGKSLLQAIITAILGGRYSRPYQYMTGGTPFNADLFGAEHLIIEDEVPSTDFKARRAFGSQIKNATVNDGQRCHAKGRTPVMLRPFWRMTISLNDEPEDLMVLPPLDGSLEDKMILFRCVPFTMPQTTETPQQRQELWQNILNELPAFLHTLTTWEIPTEMRSDRFGVLHFHHPAIVDALTDLSPEGKLLQLIEANVLNGSPWEGSATDLEDLLTGSDSACSYQAKRILSYSTATGVYLSRLSNRMPNRIIRGKTGSKGRFWTIYPKGMEPELDFSW